MAGTRAAISVWTPLTGIWYFRLTVLRFRAALLKGLNSTYWNLVFQVKYFSRNRYESHVWTPLTGIWYFRICGTAARLLYVEFELHLLESGISGEWSPRDSWRHFRLNSTYWNLVFQVRYSTAWKYRHDPFELHLLESGISGRKADTRCKQSRGFELHLLESGISGWWLS